ncbi:AAA family ATPase [Ruegeria sp. 2205SS24-7]|uniref:AAA family ATPase n=1 Tax=Ruegeria discodermiae TaxID=3064389 RepID=UPI0027427ACB|nr:AAA family ATPase [Ruegeria sp. 2205SS24-7]MDP5215618.1 AAA family ATPase [Ruegeria sp. 2205SS24-7]
MPVLICLSGLLGVGKTTIARQLARKMGALWLWLDEVETAMKASQMQVVDDLADGGYAALRAVAKGALRQGFDVIADNVNPIELTRTPWRAVSQEVAASHIDVELICSDPDTHRYRVENRKVALPGWVGPDWQSVQAREYDPMPQPDLRIDTALTSVDESFARIYALIKTEN